MSINVVLDHAGTLTYVTGADTLLDTMKTADRNPRLPGVNTAWVEVHTAQELEDMNPYPVTEIPYSELESWDRSGCEYDECHNYAFGPEYKSEKYCDEHAGPVTDEYADVAVIWEGAIDSHDTCYERAEIVKIITDTEEAVKERRLEGTFNEEMGVQVAVSYHVHEFPTRERMDEFDGDCWCNDGGEMEYDSAKDEPGENGRPEKEEGA